MLWTSNVLMSCNSPPPLIFFSHYNGAATRRLCAFQLAPHARPSHAPAPKAREIAETWTLPRLERRNAGDTRAKHESKCAHSRRVAAPYLWPWLSPDYALILPTGLLSTADDPWLCSWLCYCSISTTATNHRLFWGLQPRESNKKSVPFCRGLRVKTKKIH